MDDGVLRIIQHDQEYFTLRARSFPELYDGYKPFSIWGFSALVAFSLRSLTLEQSKFWFPYDRPDRLDRPSRLKKCSDDLDDHMETRLKDKKLSLLVIPELDCIST